ncbi:hypothetical protein PQX77_011538 [Marasmius sp. AFHP31]|nr:hypothetical protein PQX77_011538 [Marasmius sp. AFHP31]
MSFLPKIYPKSILISQDSTLEGETRSAYQVCLDLESQAKTNQQYIHARVLGYFIIHAPSVQALSEVQKQIHSCENDYDNLFTLGESFVKYFIRPFKKTKGRTPAPSSRPSRPSFDKDKEKWTAEIKEAPKDHREAKRQALIRDGFQCVVTGLYDDSAFGNPRIDQEALRDVTVSVNTKCAHIVSESTYFNISYTSAKKDYSASVLAALKRFGYDVNNLNGAKVHSLYNVMTMEQNVHDWFDNLNLWFEKIPNVNRYRVKTASGRIPNPNARTEITFTTTSELPLPSPDLLALHAACAKVAHLSGAAAYIDELDRDTDDLCVLAHDGGSFSILNNALLRSLPSIDVGV